MKWIDYYQIYLGMKLHFENSSYSYAKYGPKRVNEASIKRQYLLLKTLEGKGEDKATFERRLIGIFKNKVRYISDLYSQECNAQFDEYTDEISNWSYYLSRDLQYICEEAQGKGLSFREIFFSNNEFHLPFIVSMLERGRINYHTVAALASIIPFRDRISPMLFNVLALEKYMELHNFSKTKIAGIVKPFKENFDVETP